MGLMENHWKFRVVRKWQPFKRAERCYLLVDINGDAIEAVATERNAQHMIDLLEINQCYSIRKYICTNKRYMMHTVEHEASIMLAKYTQAVPIDKDNIPTYHFNFLPYDLLHTRTNTKDLLTDYIGCLVAIKPSDDADEENRRDFLTLKNDSNKSVRVTLWPEIRKTFDQSVVENTDAPVVVAITSTKVGNLILDGDMQLSSTPATAVFVNPPIPELLDLKKRYRQLNYPAPAITSVTTYPTMTVAEAMDLFNNQTTRQQVECVATIKDIIAGENKAWYYKSCNLCKNKAFKIEATTSTKGKEITASKDFYRCATHEVVNRYILRYCASVILKDATGNTTATFFDEPMAALLGESCEEMMKKEGYPTAKKCPTTFRKLIGVQKKFRIQQHHEENRQLHTCVICRVSDPTTATTTIEIPATGLLPQTPDKQSKKRGYPDTTGTDTPPMKETKN
ncbi:replication protein A 70 kDa DNA-binding subunit B-like [Bidens hawaiensis]|uniref:replication protein A 70 kDa DNA-binding subunit B-like n=1 Tax=Bidens hawaiensis TaxID=980011 RepID=UPI0040496BD7